MNLVFTVVSLLSFTLTYAQEPTVPASPPKQKNSESFASRLFISPDIGLQFGTVTIINVAPKVGYRVTEKFAAGLGFSYVYLKDKSIPNFTYVQNIYGGSIFSQYQLFESIRLYSEYELLNIQTNDPFSSYVYKEWIPSLFVGGGYSQRLGGNSSFVIMALFNLIDGPNSIYDNPLIRIGFNIGL